MSQNLLQRLKPLLSSWKVPGYQQQLESTRFGVVAFFLGPNLSNFWARLKQGILQSNILFRFRMLESIFATELPSPLSSHGALNPLIVPGLLILSAHRSFSFLKMLQLLTQFSCFLGLFPPSLSFVYDTIEEVSIGQICSFQPVS